MREVRQTTAFLAEAEEVIVYKMLGKSKDSISTQGYFWPEQAFENRMDFRGKNPDEDDEPIEDDSEDEWGTDDDDIEEDA